MGNIVGDPFSLATIGIAIVSPAPASMSDGGANWRIVRMAYRLRQLYHRKSLSRVSKLLLVGLGLHVLRHRRRGSCCSNGRGAYIPCGNCRLSGRWTRVHNVFR